MVVSVLNADPAQATAKLLLDEHLHPFCDVDVVVAHKHYPAHRAVLAVHSLEFRAAFSPGAGSGVSSPKRTVTSLSRENAAAPDAQRADDARRERTRRTFRVVVALDHADEQAMIRGWQLVYAYMYGEAVKLDTEWVLAALPICRRYRFDELACVLDAFLCEGAVTEQNCTRVYAAAAVAPSSSAAASGARDSDAQLVLDAAWQVMKSRFVEVADWSALPYHALVKLLKLNDLNVSSEARVFDAVQQWVFGNESTVEASHVASVVKLVRFPTMTQAELELAAASRLVSKFGVCRKYVSRGLAAKSDERRGLVRSVVMESSPVYRVRRTDALTFSDRVGGWRRLEHSVSTSSRYFAGCLWNLVVEKGGEWVGLFLGCQCENDEQEMDVELDLCVFLVRHCGAKAELVSKQVKGACFGRSGQRIGFRRMVRTAEIDREGSRLLLRDTLFVGASIRLRWSQLAVIGISEDGDDTAESESCMM
eukprot:TRINITY_DN40137_c0_g1_i1.p1 TRINITY_DN40137_c0_g1~~TRINITY_DN40137_c0_g1_i1.p1  ORF type:complete len:479 (+),score=106.64 TRINITY_DN40137_c0_g1_i1:155-1591(+)